MSIYQSTKLTINNFSFSFRSDKYFRQLTDIGGDSIGFGCEDVDICQGQNNGIPSFELVIESQISQEVTELTVEKSLSIFDRYSRPLTDIGGDSIGFGCENS